MVIVAYFIHVKVIERSHHCANSQLHKQAGDFCQQGQVCSGSRCRGAPTLVTSRVYGEDHYCAGRESTSQWGWTEAKYLLTIQTEAEAKRSGAMHLPRPSRPASCTSSAHWWHLDSASPTQCLQPERLDVVSPYPLKVCLSRLAIMTKTKILAKLRHVCRQ